MTIPAPDIPDRFEILEVLADHEAELRYRARDKTLLREVILKLPGAGMQELLRESGDEERALREARALARIAHPGVVKLIDVIPSGRGPLMVLEPSPGAPLAEHLEARGRLSPAEVRRLGVEIAAALAAVHATGAVHRGLSEDNILIRPDGSACLAGFLFAKFPKSAVSLSSIIYQTDPNPEEEGDAEAQRSRLLPDHPAPEQIMGQVADARSDLFGLGCALYRALTGAPAFRDIVADGWSPPDDLRKLAPDVPRELAAAVMKCLSRSPLARFQTAHDLQRALEEAPAARRRAPKGAAVAALAAVALAIPGVFLWSGGDGESTTRGGVPDVIESGSARNARGGPGPYEPRYAASRALVIGIGEAYGENGFAPLPNAERDAVAVADALRALDDGWQVTTLLGDAASEAGIKAAFQALESTSPNDRVLLYYAGHGVPHQNTEKVGYLVPADARTEQDDPSRANWISFSVVDELFDMIPAKHVLMLMDCCYAGRMGKRRAAGAPLNAFDAVYLTQKAQHIIASARREAEDGQAGGHSPFAEGVLKALRGAAAPDPDAPTLYGSALYQQILNHMRSRESRNIPELRYGPDSEGEFVLSLGRS